MRNPKVLVLDEATSALEAESERQVKESLDDMMKGRGFTTLLLSD